MTPRETVQAAFRFEQTDEIPYWLWIEGDIDRRIAEHYGTPNWREGRLKTYVVGRHFGFPETSLPDGTFMDAFGVHFQPGNILHVVKAPLDRPSLSGYRWPDMSKLAAWGDLAREVQSQPDVFHLHGFGFGLFERAWLMRGFENILMDLHENPDFVEELLDGIMAMHLQAIDMVAEKVKPAAYFGADDFCDQRGVIMGPALWRKFFKPRHARLVERCHQRGLQMVMHSCGNLLPLIDDLMEIGLDGLESLQPEAMDVFELRRRTEGRMILMGGLGVQRLMPFGKPEEVTRQARRLMSEMTRRGGYVLAAAKPLQGDTPTANAVALVEAAMNNHV